MPVMRRILFIDLFVLLLMSGMVQTGLTQTPERDDLIDSLNYQAYVNLERENTIIIEAVTAVTDGLKTGFDNF